MNKKTLFIIILILCFVFVIGCYLFNEWYHTNIKSHKTMYCYEYFRGENKTVSVLIIKNLRLKEPYLRYYKELENGIEPYLDNNIPIKTLPQYEPVYVIEYTQDSLLAKVVSYYDYGPYRGGSFTKGWVYSKCLHKEPPPKQEKNNR